MTVLYPVSKDHHLTSQAANKSVERECVLLSCLPRASVICLEAPDRPHLEQKKETLRYLAHSLGRQKMSDKEKTDCGLSVVTGDSGQDGREMKRKRHFVSHFGLVQIRQIRQSIAFERMVILADTQFRS